MRKHCIPTLAGLGLSLAGCIGMSAPASAQEAARETREVRNVIIKRADKDGRPVSSHRRDISEFRAKCDGANKAESNVSSGEGDRKFVTRIMVCGDRGESSAEVRSKLLEALRKARAELNERDEIGTERRNDALAALDREIARVQAESN